jgi:hypothetical protein
LVIVVCQLAESAALRNLEKPETDHQRHQDDYGSALQEGEARVHTMTVITDHN